MKAVLIPSNASLPVQLVEVEVETTRQLQQMQSLVGGYLEHTQYDTDSSMWVDEEGRRKALPLNERATTYIRQESTAAKQGRMDHAPPDYGLYGNVVITGAASEGNITEVPQRLIDHFGAFELTAEGGDLTR